MRTIKLRGQIKNDPSYRPTEFGKGAWVVGLLSKRPCIDKGISYKFYINTGENEFEVDPDTVGQLTCKDYNDNDIYDGDIIEGESGIRHLIQFNEEEARFEAVLLPLNPWNNNGALRQSWIQEFKKCVIGNKFDNPEMVTSEY